jgi:hydrogenase/urease accessory protein HupE
LKVKTSILIPFIIILLGLPIVVEAHTISKTVGDFYGGIMHTLLVMAHVFPLIALSIIAGQQGPVLARRGLGAFLTALFAGAVTAFYTGPIVAVFYVNMISFIVLGILAALSLRLPRWFFYCIIIFFGFTHGFQNGMELTDVQSPTLFLTGLLAGGLILFSIFAALTVSIKKEWFQIALRVIGSWVAAMGLMLIALF